MRLAVFSPSMVPASQQQSEQLHNCYYAHESKAVVRSLKLAGMLCLKLASMDVEATALRHLRSRSSAVKYVGKWPVHCFDLACSSDA